MILTHEILHHLYHTMKGREELFKERFERYLNDDSLNEKERETRDQLLQHLEAWKNRYKPKTEEEWNKYRSNEAHSVIGEWLVGKYTAGGFFLNTELGSEWRYGIDLRFPSYLLELYEGILKPEIVAQGK